MSRQLDGYLLELLRKTDKAYPNPYFFKAQEHTASEEARMEEDGIQELKSEGYLTIKSAIPDSSRSGKTRYAIIMVELTVRGKRYLREQESREEVQRLNETIDQVPDQFQSTRQHLIQARKQLAELDDPRSRKDAVRDCLSALEALVKSISGANDIKAGVTVLRGQEFGADEILREIQTVWQHLHQGDFRDVRHGQAIVHELDQAEALYWIERVLALVNYLSRLSTAPSGTGSATTPT